MIPSSITSPSSPLSVCVSATELTALEFVFVMWVGICVLQKMISPGGKGQTFSFFTSIHLPTPTPVFPATETADRIQSLR